MQKYLTDKIPKEKLPKQYSVMSAYITAVKPLLTFSSNKKDYGFNPNGMGRTRIGEDLAKGRDPQVYYNSSQTVASQALKRELLIREFFHQAPKEWEPRRPEASWYEGSKAKEFFRKWKAGETGYLLVDAGMKQLATEGWMPNRVRMLCASFLTKNLMVWWEDGEKYFASKLIDYNPDSNLGNWQWVSGTGFNSRLTDVLSPDIQLRAYDSGLAYCRAVLGPKLVLPTAKAQDYIREPGLYKVPQIISYHESKEKYLTKL